MNGGEGGRGEGRLIPEPWATFKKFTMYVYKIFYFIFFSFPILIFTILCAHTQVIADWSVQNLSFSMFKTRGELLLKGAETSEIVSLMEDSLMVLGSLMSNR